LTVTETEGAPLTLQTTEEFAFDAMTTEKEETTMVHKTLTEESALIGTEETVMGASISEDKKRVSAGTVSPRSLLA